MTAYTPEIIRFLNLIPEPFEAIIVCYPRSGSTYLGRYMDQRAMIHLKKSHACEVLPGYKIVGTFRKPEESITFFVSMESYYQNRTDYQVMINKEIAKYNQMLDFLIKNADIMVDYQRMIMAPEESIKLVCNALGINVKYHFDYIDQIEDMPKDKFLKSSKYLKQYRQIENMVLESDLEASKNLYSMALKLDKTI